jgi:hypothetical protein
MTEELAVQETSVVIANHHTELPALQAPLAGWARQKLEAVRTEYNELDQAATLAKKNKWNPHAIRRAANKALERLTFYEKVVAALEAGYMLFPPVPNADVIAIRSDGYGSRENRDTVGWRPPLEEAEAEALPLGEGEYKSPWMGWNYLCSFKDEKGNEKTRWTNIQELETAEFPLVMAKPQIVEATNAAMEGKFFDEIRLFPFTKRRGDPCILGALSTRPRRTDCIFSSPGESTKRTFSRGLRKGRKLPDPQHGA